MSLGWKLILLAIGLVIAGLAFIAFFGAVWLRWGFGGAFLFLAAVLVVFGWMVDRKERKIRESLEDGS